MNNINFTVKELAKYINCSESSIRRMTKEKSLPYFRIGAKLLYPKDKIDNWIEFQTTANIERR